MKINYTDFNGIQKFYIETHGKCPDKIAEDLFHQFKTQDDDDKKKLKTYLELVKKEKEIVKQRKSLLLEIKDDFQKFTQEEYPEYFI